MAARVTNRITLMPMVAVSGGSLFARVVDAGFCWGTVWAPSADSTAKADPRIEPRIQQIDHDVDHDYPGRRDGHERLDDRHVAGGDGLAGQAAHAGGGEDTLAGHCVAEHEHH